MIVDYMTLTLVIFLGAVALDLLIGDPKWLPHPVIGMGKLISFLEQRWNQGEHRRGKGVALTIVVVGISYLVAFLLLFLAYKLHMMLGVLLEIYLISTTIAIKGLRQAALQVAFPLIQGNLTEARKQLSMIVGRDTETLSEAEIVRGTVETVAENTVDGITAPLFFALLGGAPLAIAYRAINTLDSMVGYKNERFQQFGWASARLDDVSNWIPARLTSLTIWLSALFIRPFSLVQALRITLRDAPKHPSPNSGWSEAMVAGLLGIQLGGVNSYGGVLSERARMGEGTRELRVEDIKHTILFMHGGWVIFLIFILAIKLWIGS
jgi:adenosylcobinamide-phosphate synthase